MQKLFASNEIDRARRQREYGRFHREIDAERRPMYPVSGHRNGAVDYTYMFAIDTKYNTAVADYTVVIQSTVNTLIPAGARVFEYSHNQTPIAPGTREVTKSDLALLECPRHVEIISWP
ncbi:unnamed protein product [Sphagnum jensenii]|uniref:Uncharacterized protein n=1 Tax=Sphagnum jensenii TaxID=128206 RepID=A0ABP0XGL7_9BRYO